MEAFFATFPGFVHNLDETPEQNFRRLEGFQVWTSPQSLTFRPQFFSALVQSTNSTVHTFFVTLHPDFLTYDSDMPPRCELERLRMFKNWASDGLFGGYRARFETAFQAEFSTALDAYFASCPYDFLYDPRRAPMVEFNRLMRHYNWNRDEVRYESARKEFFVAFMVDFNQYFGGGEDDMRGWRHLCEVLGVDPLPDTITHCRKILKRYHVNIHDLVQHKRTGAEFERFATPKALRKYTKRTGLVFPKEVAKQGALKFLLRPIFSSGRRG